MEKYTNASFPESWNKVKSLDWKEFVEKNYFPPPTDDSKIDIEEIAFSLSRTFRYGGRSKVSVDVHSVRTAQIARDNTKGSHLKKICYVAGLLHDANEAWTGDVLWPMKKMVGFEVFKELEQRVNYILYPIFGLDSYLAFDKEFQEYISRCDYMANNEEVSNLLELWDPPLPKFRDELKRFYNG